MSQINPHNDSAASPAIPPPVAPPGASSHGKDRSGTSAPDPQSNGEAVGVALRALSTSLGQSLHSQHALLTFEEFLTTLRARPDLVLRNSAQVVADALTASGTKRERVLGRDVTTFNCFREVVGQEVAIDSCHRWLCLRGAEAFPSRMLTVHGPSGSGKNTFLRELLAQVYQYTAHHPEGTLYRLVWRLGAQMSGSIADVFNPRGLRDLSDRGQVEEEVLVRADLHTNPLFLVPREWRGERPRETLLGLLDTGNQQGPFHENGKSKAPPSYNRGFALGGELDPLSIQILKRLEQHYVRACPSEGGAQIFERILRQHVRVEKWALSDGEGVVTIASEADRAAGMTELFPRAPFESSRIPRELGDDARELRRTDGGCCSASNGLLILSDYLRQKAGEHDGSQLHGHDYLLELAETGEVLVGSRGYSSRQQRVVVRTVVIGTSNDQQIMQKWRNPGFEPLRQRMDFLTFGQIRKPRSEELVLTGKVKVALRARHAPQLSADGVECLTQAGYDPILLPTVALFFVASRMIKPDATKLSPVSKALASTVAKLSVVELALLLNGTGTGADLDLNILRDNSRSLKTEEIATLRRHEREVADLGLEGVGVSRFSLYPGGVGLSTRESSNFIQELVSQNSEGSLCVIDALDRIHKLCDKGFSYFARVEAERDSLRELIRKEVSAGPKAPNSSQEIENAVSARLQTEFPLPAADSVYQQIELFARRSMQRYLREVFREVAGVQEITLPQYISHLKAKLVPGSEVPLEHRTIGNSKQSTFEDAVLHEFEDKFFLTHDKGGAAQRLSPKARTEQRQSIFYSIAAWSQRNSDKPTMEHLNEILPEVVKQVQEVQSTELYGERIAKLVSGLQRLSDDAQVRDRNAINEGEQREIEKMRAALLKRGFPEDSLVRLCSWAVQVRS